MHPSTAAPEQVPRQRGTKKTTPKPNPKGETEEGMNMKMMPNTTLKPKSQASQIFLPLTHAITSANSRLRDALVSLSVAEIRPSVSFAQILDTVNELHTAVVASVNVHQLYVTETVEAAASLADCMSAITRLEEARRTSSSAEAYRSGTNKLFDEIRLSRYLRKPPALNAAVIVVPGTKQTQSAKHDHEIDVDTNTDTDKDKKALETRNAERRSNEAMIKQRFKTRFKF